MKISKKEVIVTMVPSFSVDFHGNELYIPDQYIYPKYVYIAVDKDGTVCLFADVPKVTEAYGPKNCELGAYFDCEVDFSEMLQYLTLGNLTEEDMATMPSWDDSCIEVELPDYKLRTPE